MLHLLSISSRARLPATAAVLALLACGCDESVAPLTDSPRLASAAAAGAPADTPRLELAAAAPPAPAPRDAGAASAQHAETSNPSEAPIDAETLAMLDELRRLETQVPETVTRSPRAPIDASAVIVPGEVTRDLTATVVVREEPAGPVFSRETYRLSPDAVSVSAEGGVEWWLARNPVHRAELFGAHVDPSEKVVMHHSAGDLRLTVNEGLWDRIAALGGRGTLPEGLRVTGSTDSAFGLEFVQWVATDDTSPLREVLWNADAGLMLRSRALVEGRTLVREITALEWSVDPAELRYPGERHPTFQVSEISDWGDSCGGAAHAHAHAADGADTHAHGGHTGGQR